ncbi:hypothetical protein KP509_24G008200 [Ceratopteris richardii]|uniref:Uncharacterized protein n=1 Tax=Ceratopteris richardii TaxID=49495 RepID=A0A8T2RSC4_CERRI|nr:hypothetical protein KP509_24G008200 [Ceratopteris richardii]
MLREKGLVEESRKEHWSPGHRHRRSSSWSGSAAFLRELRDGYEEIPDTEQAPAPVVPIPASHPNPKKERSLLISRIRNSSGMKLNLHAVKDWRDAECEEHVGGDGSINADSRIRKEHIAACEKDCTCILPYLFLSGSSVAQNLAVLQDSRITHIINFVGFVCEENFPNEFIYRTLWLQDSQSEDIMCVLYDVFDLIEIVREQSGCRVLLHCCQGVSRSAAFTIAYLMWRKSQSFDESFQEVQAMRIIINPNMGFVSQLMHWERKLSSPSERDALQIYRIAPQSPYDPLYLVPKLEGAGGIELLDTRGAFVIRFANMLYLWRGERCQKEMITVADNAAFQLVRYERAQGPCVLVREGNEAADIPHVWPELVRLSKPRPVGGMVARYNSDYEMYTKAKANMFLPPRLSTGIVINVHPRDEKWNPLHSSLQSNTSMHLS